MFDSHFLYCYVDSLKRIQSESPLKIDTPAAQRAKFAEKVQKPPLGFNLNQMGLMNQYGSLEVPQTPKSCGTNSCVKEVACLQLFFCTIYFQVCEPFRQSQPSVSRSWLKQIHRPVIIVCQSVKSTHFSLNIWLRGHSTTTWT